MFSCLIGGPREAGRYNLSVALLGGVMHGPHVASTQNGETETSDEGRQRPAPLISGEESASRDSGAFGLSARPQSQERCSKHGWRG